MYSRSAKGGEKGDPNRNPWLAKMISVSCRENKWYCCMKEMYHFIVLLIIEISIKKNQTPSLFCCTKTVS
jgi:hypothetical protein